MLTNIAARCIYDYRVVLRADAFAEIVVWEVPEAVIGSTHGYRYRLALVADDVCVLRYDNERGKGDHVHVTGKEYAYLFVSIDQLLNDFRTQAERWLDENPHD